VLATHLHLDFLFGLNEFHSREIPSYAASKTIELAKASGYPLPENGFNPNSKTL
jgi:metallo-beta-lactamase class B